MNQDECPICYKTYGIQHDGSFLCKDGKHNSDYAESCKHYICTECCYQLSKQKNVKCPMCREDWDEWLRTLDEDSDHNSDDYSDEDSDEDSDDSDDGDVVFSFEFTI